MSAKVDQKSSVEPQIIKMSPTSTSPAASTIGPKVSMFAKKSGFVIPKNKLSGSLVPVFRGGKKEGGSEAANEEGTNQVQRKTKWGTDLTQDAAVRRGRALAYQTRVDQITRQLKSGYLNVGDKTGSPSNAEHVDDTSPNTQVDSKKSELLEIEKGEIIGEILKLNPSYKVPPDYKPLLKEAIVPLPVKEYPGYNFIGLIFGPAGDTQKRFEKETGAKVQVYGMKANSGDKVEISSPDSNDIRDTYEELYVQISADTFEKVDAAVALIELLVTSISGNLGADSTSTSVSGENVNLLSQEQGSAAPYTVLTSVNLGVPQLTPTSSQGQFQYQGPWPPRGMPSMNLSAPVLNNPAVAQLPASNTPPLFGTQPGAASGYNSVLQNPSFVPTSSKPPIHLFGHTGHPRNFPLLTPNPSAAQPTISSPLPIIRPLTPMFPQPTSSVSLRPLPDRPVAPAGSSAGWSGAPASLGPRNMAQLAPAVFPPQGSHPLGMLPGATSTSSHPPNFPTGPSGPQLTNTPSSRPASMAFAPNPPPLGPPAVSVPLHPTPVHAPVPNQSSAHAAEVAPFPNPSISHAMGATPIPVPSTAPPPSVQVVANIGPMNPQTMTVSRPQRPSSGDFTFQPHQPHNPASQMVPRPGTQQSTTIAPSPGPMTQMPAPQAPSFQFAGPNLTPQPVMQSFPRQQGGNQIGRPQAQISSVPFAGQPKAMTGPPRPPVFPDAGHVAAATPVPQMGVRNFIPAPRMPNMVGPFAPMPGNSVQLQQNYPALPPRPGNYMPPNLQFANSFPRSTRPASTHSRGQQNYDPFSPTSVSVAPQQKRGSLPKERKQENDPEYEDLMASVGVK
ncbi:hypothetical protein SLA2020_433840 [Shorea laevis]